MSTTFFLDIFKFGESASPICPPKNIIVPKTYYQDLLSNKKITQPIFLKLVINLETKAERAADYRILCTTQKRGQSICSMLKNQHNKSTAATGSFLRFSRADEKSPYYYFSYRKPDDSPQPIEVKIPLTGAYVNRRRGENDLIIQMQLLKRHAYNRPSHQAELKILPFQLDFESSVSYCSGNYIETGGSTPSARISWQANVRVTCSQLREGLWRRIKGPASETIPGVKADFDYMPEQTIGDVSAWQAVFKLHPYFDYPVPDYYIQKDIKHICLILTRSYKHDEHLAVWKTIASYQNHGNSLGAILQNRASINPTSPTVNSETAQTGKKKYRPYIPEEDLLLRLQEKLINSRFAYDPQRIAFSTVLNKKENILKITDQYDQALRSACGELHRTHGGLDVVEFFIFNESLGNKNVSFIKEWVMTRLDTF